MNVSCIHLPSQIQIPWCGFFWVSPLVFGIKGTNPLCCPWSCLCRDLSSCSSNSSHAQAKGQPEYKSSNRVARCNRVCSSWSPEESSWDAQLDSSMLVPFFMPLCYTQFCTHLEYQETVLRGKAQVGWACILPSSLLCVQRPVQGLDYSSSSLNTHWMDA